MVAVYQPKAIYLFGSQAWGAPTVDSDVDLMVIVNQSDEKKTDRIRRGLRALWSLKIPMDLLVFTQEEVYARSSHPSNLIHKVLAEGQCLYETV